MDNGNTFRATFVREKLTPIQERLHKNAMAQFINPASVDDAIFQHSVLCQTFLPYRNPGDAIRLWQQKQGNVSLALQAGNLLNPATGEYEPIGLPFGTKSRLILAHINSQAIKKQSPSLNIEDSMTAFIKSLGLGTDGRTMQEVKEQLRRLNTSVISLGYSDGERGMQVDLKIMKAFDLWFPKDERQRVFWTSQVQLTDDYFNSLMHHAIPLDERALAALSHNAMALDIYAWLAQRLHRIEFGKPQFVAWKNLKDQFGCNYGEMKKFKQVFRRTLAIVRLQYMKAKFEEVPNKGLLLHHSPTPIPQKTFQVPGIADKST